MLLAGDEFGRTQYGNNNAYCQDNAISWVAWTGIHADDEALRDFTRYLIHLRRKHRVFSRPRYFLGEVVSADGLKDITWVTPDGLEYTQKDWNHPSAHCFGFVLCGDAGEFYTPGGQRDIDRSFLVMMNAYHEDIAFTIPELPVTIGWEALIDTANENGMARPAELLTNGDIFSLKARSVVVFIDKGAPLSDMIEASDALVPSDLDMGAEAPVKLS